MIRRALILLAAPVLMAAPLKEQHFTLPNGLRVILLEDHTLPQVRVHVGLDFEASERLAPFVGALLEGTGAGSMSAATFARTLEERGGWLQAAWSPGTLEWQLQVGSVELEGALELLAHAVFRPVYDAARVDQLRARLLKQAQERTARDGALDLFLGRLGHPRGGRVPGESSLSQTTFQELVAYRRGVTDPRRAAVVLYGDLALPLARQTMLQNFGSWTPPPATAPTKAAGVPDLIQIKGLPAEAWAGIRVVFADDSQREAFDVLGQVCCTTGLESGQSPSLLSESDGFRLEWTRGEPQAGVILAHLASPSPRADLLERLVALRQKGLTQGELDRAQEQLQRQRAMLPLHPQQLVEDCLDRHRAPEDAPTPKLQLAQVRSLLEAWLRPEGLKFLVVKGE